MRDHTKDCHGRPSQVPNPSMLTAFLNSRIRITGFQLNSIADGVGTMRAWRPLAQPCQPRRRPRLCCSVSLPADWYASDRCILFTMPRFFVYLLPLPVVSSSQGEPVEKWPFSDFRKVDVEEFCQRCGSLLRVTLIDSSLAANALALTFDAPLQASCARHQALLDSSGRGRRAEGGQGSTVMRRPCGSLFNICMRVVRHCARCYRRNASCWKRCLRRWTPTILATYHGTRSGSCWSR